MGFREIRHTADSAIAVWAPDLPSLFAEAARGMNHVAGAMMGQADRVKRSLVLNAENPEDLLVGFLNELVYAQEDENLGFDQFEIELSSTGLAADVIGSALVQLVKPIKAATYHNMKILRTRRGYEVEIVFDI